MARKKAASTTATAADNSNRALSTSIANRYPTSPANGPSPFPRRLPLPGSPVVMTKPQQQQQQQQSRASSTSSSSSSSPQHHKTPKEEADNMARKLTRFYTANFERRPVITLCVTNSLLSAIGDAAAQLIPIIGAAAGAPVPAWDIDRTLRFAMFGFSIGPMIEKWNRFLEYRFPLRPVDQAFPDRATTGQEGGFDPSVEDPNSPAFIEKLKGYAAKEGFKVNVDRGDEQQGQQYASYEKGGQRAVDPQHVAMPNMGQPGQISVVALAQRVFADQLFMAPLGLALFISTMAVLEGLEWDQIVERYKALYLPILLINWQIWPFVQIINFRYLPLRYRVPFSASLGVLWTVFLSFKNAKVTAKQAA